MASEERTRQASMKFWWKMQGELLSWSVLIFLLLQYGHHCRWKTMMRSTGAAIPKGHIYHNKTHASITRTLYTDVSYNRALYDAAKCLGLSQEQIDKIASHTFEERKAHYEYISEKINKSIRNRFRQHSWMGYNGPWIEDLWMDMRNEPFETFGPFVPLFVPWVGMWIINMGYYMMQYRRILALLQPDFLYVTVNFNDDGVDGRDRSKTLLPPNVLVISGGGNGHIPAFIYLNKTKPSDFPIATSYKYDMMFVGGITHPVRPQLIENYTNYLGDRFYNAEGKDWRELYPLSKFIAAPRGYGRNSYRMTEILLSGFVPVYIYSDIVWLPYYDSLDWNSFSIVTHISKLNETVDRIRNTTPEEVARMRRKIASLYDTHFTEAAMFNHIRLLLTGGFEKSDLRCSTFSSKRNL